MTCSICLERHVLQALQGCTHSFCVACLRRMLALGRTGCPSCKADIPEAQIQGLLDPGSYASQRHQQRQLQKYVAQHRSQLALCPTADCPFFVELEGPRLPLSICCPQCSTCFCGLCSQVHDSGSSHCPSDLVITGTKPCPSCGCKIEKRSGCPHMQCSLCDHAFCWLCLEAWSSEHPQRHAQEEAMTRYFRMPVPRTLTPSASHHHIQLRYLYFQHSWSLSLQLRLSMEPDSLYSSSTLAGLSSRDPQLSKLGSFHILSESSPEFREALQYYRWGNLLPAAPLSEHIWLAFETDYSGSLISLR